MGMEKKFLSLMGFLKMNLAPTPKEPGFAIRRVVITLRLVSPGCLIYVKTGHLSSPNQPWICLFGHKPVIFSSVLFWV